MDKQAFKQHINMLLSKQANGEEAAKKYNLAADDVRNILTQAIGAQGDISRYGQAGMGIRRLGEKAQDLYNTGNRMGALYTMDLAKAKARDLRDTIDAHKSFTGALTEAAPSYFWSNAAGALTGYTMADKGNKGTGVAIGMATATLLNLLRRKIKYGSGVWA